MARWLLKGPGGEREQVCTVGEVTPTQDGANPKGWREVRLTSHTDNLDSNDFDETTGRWQECAQRAARSAELRRARARAWLDALPAGASDLIAEAVAERLAGDGAQAKAAKGPKA